MESFWKEKLLKLSILSILSILILFASEIQIISGSEFVTPEELAKEVPSTPSSVQEEGVGDIDIKDNSPCKDLSDTTGESYKYDIERKICISVANLTKEVICADNMEFQVMAENNLYGFCDCISSRPAFYNESTKNCHLLYKQEYCLPGEWLIYNDKNGQAICTENKCDQFKSDETEEMAMYKGKCVLIGYGNPACEYNMIMLFKPGHVEPDCVRLDETRRKMFGFGLVPHLQCSEGTKWSHLTDRCQKTFQFTLS